MEWKQLKLFLFPWKIIIIYNKKETMIYLENNNGTQQIFIPKNLNISINKTYDEGFQDGMNYQKEKLEDLNVTENGVYKSDNGYKQVNVEVANENVCKLEELNITIVNDIEEYTATDSNLDGFSKVNVDATEFGENRYNLGYEQGYEQGKSDIGCNVGFKYHIVKDDTETINASEFGYDGFSEVEIYAAEYGNKKYEEGYNQGKSEGGEGGSCNIQETKWVHPSINDIDSNGYLVYYKDDGYDGMDRIALQMDNYNQEIGGGGDFTSSQVEETYSINAIEILGMSHYNPWGDKSKMTDINGNYNENGFILLRYGDINSVWCTNNSDDGFYTIAKINEGTFSNSEFIKEIKFNTKIELGENVLQGEYSNIRKIFFNDVKLKNNSLNYSNNLSKICFGGRVELDGNPFPNINGSGTVYGISSLYDECYAPIMNLLGGGWNFVGCEDINQVERHYYN